MFVYHDSNLTNSRFSGCINTRNIIHQSWVSVDKDMNCYQVAKFMKYCIMLHDTVRLCYRVLLSKQELCYITDY